MTSDERDIGGGHQNIWSHHVKESKLKYVATNMSVFGWTVPNVIFIL